MRLKLLEFSAHVDCLSAMRRLSTARNEISNFSALKSNVIYVKLEWQLLVQLCKLFFTPVAYPRTNTNADIKSICTNQVMYYFKSWLIFVGPDKIVPTQKPVRVLSASARDRHQKVKIHFRNNEHATCIEYFRYQKVFYTPCCSHIYATILTQTFVLSQQHRPCSGPPKRKRS